MQTLVEDFLQYLRHERGQAEHTQKTYAALLGKFIEWAAKQNLTDWKSVELKHLMGFLRHERERNLFPVGRVSSRAVTDPERSGGSRGRSPHRQQIPLTLMLEKCHEMLQLDLFPIVQSLLLRPGDEFAQQGGVGFLGVFGLPAFVPQVLQKIFKELVHQGFLPVSRS